MCNSTLHGYAAPRTGFRLHRRRRRRGLFNEQNKELILANCAAHIQTQSGMPFDWIDVVASFAQPKTDKFHCAGIETKVSIFAHWTRVNNIRSKCWWAGSYANRMRYASSDSDGLANGHRSIVVHLAMDKSVGSWYVFIQIRMGQSK